MRSCKVKKDEQTGRFLSNGQSRKKGLNRAISDASCSELILKIEYLAAKQGKVVIKVNPRHSSQECRNCGHVDKSNRDGEKFICVRCGHIEHADIGPAKLSTFSRNADRATLVCGVEGIGEGANSRFGEKPVTVDAAVFQLVFG